MRTTLRHTRPINMAPTFIRPLLFLAALVSAQQGLLSNGNSRLPQCGQTCPLLVQAANACPPGITTATQATWTCFCQSAYLTNLRTSATGICDSTCTNPTDLQQVSTWYTTNCGSDNGVAEHAAGAAATSATGPRASRTAAGNAAAAAATSGAGTSSAATTANGTSNVSNNGGDWFSNHYEWIIMVIVLAVCLPALAFLGIWLKRRHDRKRDQMNSGFNAGVTDRVSAMSNPQFDSAGVAAAGLAGSGVNSPARTRDAFMPYGYGYSHSDSRLGSRQAVNDDQMSPLPRGTTPDIEKEGGTAPVANTSAKKKLRKVLMRGRGGEDESEKSSRS